VVLLTHKEWNYVICKKMDGTEDHHVKWNKACLTKTSIGYFLLYVESRSLKEYESTMGTLKNVEVLGNTRNRDNRGGEFDQIIL
jgi:hypothetical protein